MALYIPSMLPTTTRRDANTVLTPSTTSSAENYYHKERRRSETRVIYTFGRADQVDPEPCAAWLRASCVWPTTIASICRPVSSRRCRHRRHRAGF